MNLIAWASLLGGLAFLLLGAEALVRGASKLARALGVSPLIIGLTIVAYGTSAPETAVSTVAGLQGKADIAVANVVGSNTFNVLFILGVAALISPLAVSRQLIRLDVPIMIGVSVLTMLLALDGVLQWWDGGLLFAGIVAYTWMLTAKTRKDAAANNAHKPKDEFDKEFGKRASGGSAISMNLLLCLGGLAVLILGTHWFVNGSIELARWLGVSEMVIGLTIIAGGTSMPEFFTSVVAAFRGERDIAVGNIVVSNIYNILAILGLSALITSGGLVVSDHLLWVDMPVMIAVAFACLPIFFTGQAIARWEGLLFLGYYAAYTAYLIMKSGSDNAATLANFRDIMYLGLIPLTVLTIGVSVFRSLRAKQGSARGGS